jgi:hypothetical protein
MQQSVQTHLSAEQLLSEASSFFSKRSAKVTDRGAQGFRFGLSGSEETGEVRIAPTGSGSTVTVEASGLTLLAIAEGYVRELRKQAKDASRLSRSGPSGAVALGDLRDRLGMPAPRPRPQVPANAGRPGAPRSNVEPSPVPASTAEATGPTGEPTTENSQPAARPDSAAPAEAASVSPVSGPEGAPAGDAAVAAPHPAQTGPQDTNVTVASEAPPVDHATANQQPSAEAIGGVPAAGEVRVQGEPPTKTA